ncbi:putative pilus system protein FilA [Acinetobacter sp. WZC-1]|uniref:putative pilus system protein FilA n=1 Tax=Acinetobacter sp. WZC-1 TaxID=3459034 RepID=UPI00403E3325
MKLFTQLALVSAVAISSNAMALQAMDDSALSATTGQDGISIGIGISKVQIDNLNVFDGDGLATTAGTPPVSTAGAAGAINLTDVVVSAPLNAAGTGPDTTRMLASHNLADLKIDTDGGNGAPFLNVAAAVSGLDIHLGPIYVAEATQDSTTGLYTADTGASSTRAEILSGLSLKTGITTANIQLGNTPQGAMIKLDGSMIGGLEISNLSLKDASAGGGGSIVMGKIKVNDTGSTDLALNADVAVRPEGLQITAMKNAQDIYIQNIRLGSASSSSIGDVQVSGLKVFNGATGTNPGAIITIAGH